MARHEVLRTSFVEADGVPYQVVHPAGEVSLAVEALDGLDLDGVVAAEAGRRFDLSRPPLYRARLLRAGAAAHVFVLVQHHILSDGWSVDLLVRELGELYGAAVAGRAPALVELRVQFADVAAWQRARFSDEVLAFKLEHWCDALAGAPRLELPTDHPRPPVMGHHGRHHHVTVDRHVAAALNALARSRGTTLFSVLFAAFNLLMARYSGQEDIVVGTPAANRAHPDLAGVAGFFINMLALRTDLTGDPSFTALVDRVSRGVSDALTHQDLPFDRLVTALRLERDPAISPLFQVVFVLQNANPGTGLRFDGLEAELTVEADYDTARYDLSFSAQEGPGGLAVRIEYDTDLYEAETVGRMADHFTRLLGAVAADPARPIHSYDILSDAERHRLLVEWNDTAVPYPRDSCIHKLFEAQVARTPDATALVFADERLSYFELNARANRLAHHLIDLGVGPETLVGIAVERSIEMVVGLLGILKAGGAYLPLDPGYPAERIAFMLEDAGCPVLLTQAHLEDGLPAHDATVVRLDADWEAISSRPDTDPVDADRSAPLTPDNLAYVIYTSGSTGWPKGVMIEHRNVVSFVAWSLRTFLPDDLARVLASTSLCFDLSVFEHFVPLSAGGTVIVVEDALELFQSGASLAPTLINTVPSIMDQLLQVGGIPAGVRVINLAGEALRAETVRRIRDRAEAVEIYNLYGPSEDTTYSTFTLVDGAGTAGPPIGRPIANTQVYILDGHANPVPVGVSGELYIGGAGLARGYLNRPELTAERFVADPFSDEPGSRLYRTGDLARYLADGNIEFLGRLDHQVKVRGFRVEPGEIEAALAAHPGVRECVVVAREDVPGAQRLIAYLVPAEDEPSVAALRVHLGQSLPDYMVPSAFVVLDALPLTPNGKLDRAALPAPEGDRAGLEGASVAPRDATEEILCGIWCALLAVDRVGIHDDFFELGGHSLLATQVISRLRAAFEVELPLRALFETPTGVTP